MDHVRYKIAPPKTAVYFIKIVVVKNTTKIYNNIRKNVRKSSNTSWGRFCVHTHIRSLPFPSNCDDKLPDCTRFDVLRVTQTSLR